MVGFGEAVSRFYRSYVNFEGRASRSEYWWPFLMQFIVYIGIIIAFLSTLNYGASDSDVFTGTSGPLFGAAVLFYLMNFLPNLSVSARRFHDLGQTGWLVLVFVLVNLVIGVAGIAQMIWFAFRGNDGPNQYGPDPFGYDADLFG